MLPALPATHSRLVFPQLHPTLEPYRTLLEGSVKPAWRLVCHRVEAISRSTTHIGGFTPYVPDELGWPRCLVCGNPLSFIWQLNFADFEAATFALRGLFQFFYCWLCFPLPGSSYDFDTLCRWFPDFTVDLARKIPQAACPYRDELPPDQLLLNRPYHVELLPVILNKWESLPFADRVRFVGALVHHVIPSHPSPCWLRMEIVWKRLDWQTDIADIRRRGSGGEHWTDEEETLLQTLYPLEDASHILQALPKRNWRAIKLKAIELGVRRIRNAPHSIPVNSEFLGMSFEDITYADENNLVLSTRNPQWSN